ncbi:hypothetical protein ASPBRDRAFT_60350 [Aspergillus brasiliensis CBS 101740]|uniref:Uncharacterized protein n=1 Tax=Aspergillus brasiliensis (strain CBS 101740 / IMI 381727 / IBT 21946) TaxID=767769 RepID=A0A1L9U1Z7_ASPBC|nr:hypothetical protein ASPBRDRAFT_60350 [Aspergillus brasiliensis CBS 101740]
MRSSIPREGDDSLCIRRKFVINLANLKSVTGPRTMSRCTTKGKLSRLAKGLKALTPVLYRTPSTVHREVLQGSFTAKSGIHLTIRLPGTDFAYDDMGQAMERQLRLHVNYLPTLSVISSFWLIVDSNQAILLIDEIDAFFAKYPRFAYNRDGPFHAEFYPSNSTVGTDAKDLASWQRICRCMKIIPIPNELRNAQQSNRTGGHLEIFATLEDLCTYTIENRKYFPKEEAYEGGLLRFLWGTSITSTKKSKGPA